MAIISGIDFEHKIADLTNSQRTNIGLSSLTYIEELADLSRVHSANMAKFGFSIIPIISANKYRKGRRSTFPSLSICL